MSEAYLSSSLWNDARARSLDAASYGVEGTTTEKIPCQPTQVQELARLQTMQARGTGNLLGVLYQALPFPEEG